MKKMILTAIFMVAIGGALSAQTTKPGNGTPGTNTNSPGYVDANKNKVCDNYENNTRNVSRKRQGQGQGQQMRRGGGNGMCRSGTMNRRGGAGRRGF